MRWDDLPNPSELILNRDIVSEDGKWIALPLPYTEGIYFERITTLVDSVESRKPHGIVFKFRKASSLGGIFIYRFLRWKEGCRAVIRVSAEDGDREMTVNPVTKECGGMMWNYTKAVFEPCGKLFVKEKEPNAESGPSR
jgi:hypothetical protein